MDIYPAIDIKGGKCVRLLQGRFDEVTMYGDDPVVMALRWRDEGAKWLHVVDLDGARSGHQEGGNRHIIFQIVRQTGLPVQFGGGVRSAEIVAEMLEIGVARVVVGTAAARDPGLAQRLFTEYGDRIAVGVDARDGIVAVQGWQEHIGETATVFMKRMAQLGAKRFIFTDIARDGMLQGVNIEALTAAAAAVPGVAVIASGGVSGMQDIHAIRDMNASHAPNVDGIIIGKALYTGDISLSDTLTVEL